MSERNTEWLKARRASDEGGWFIVISGFDGAEPPAIASFIWPEEEPLKIPNQMVLLKLDEFTDLKYRALAVGKDALECAQADAVRLHKLAMDRWELLQAIVSSETIKNACGWYPEIEAARAHLTLNGTSTTP